MKLTTLANEFLKFMVKSYADSHVKVFSFDQFKALHPELDNDFISDALYLLKKDGFVNVFSADNVAYSTTLDLSAVQSAEENTFLKKGYTVLKEIRSWL